MMAECASPGVRKGAPGYSGRAAVRPEFHNAAFVAIRPHLQYFRFCHGNKGFTRA